MAPYRRGGGWPRWWRDPTLAKAPITVAMLQLGQIFGPALPVEQPRIGRVLARIVEKVIVPSRNIEVRLRQTSIQDLALELRPAVPEEIVA